MLVGRAIESPDWVDRLASEWDEVLAESSEATPFQTLPWQQTWWKQYGRGRRAHVFELRDGKDLVGFFPMYRTRLPWRTLRAIGTGWSDYLHPIVRRGYEPAFHGLLAEHLGSLKSVDLVDFHQVRETLPLATALRDTLGVPHAHALVLDLPKRYDEYLGRLSKSLRYDCRVLERPVSVAQGAKIVTPTDPDQVSQAMSALFELHSKRWRKRALPGVFATAKARRFHTEFAIRACEAGLLRVSVLVAEGRTVGAIYAMAAGSSVFFYQSGFDPAAKALCPGTVLVAHTIRCAIEDGAETFDFMRGVEPYKLRWKPQHTLANLRLTMPLNEGLGRLGNTVNRAGGRIEHRLRERLEGKGLLA